MPINYLVLSAKLTGVSQLVGLLSAPIFGFWADRYQQFNIFLLFAALSGVLGYFWLTTFESPEVDGEKGSRWIYFVMALLGVNQIGAIICSLGIFNRCVLGLQKEGANVEDDQANDHSREPHNAQSSNVVTESVGNQESMPLLAKSAHVSDLHHLKGSIAGVYSLAGGIGILLLTKLGGVLFDTNRSAPFMMLSLFNAILLLAGIGCGLLTTQPHKSIRDVPA